MIYLNSFFIAGLFCLVGQIIVDNTRLTSGHITSLFTVLGSFLSFLGLYKKLINVSGMGAKCIITYFGASLYESGIEGYYQNGLLGLFENFLSSSSLVLVSTIIFSFLIMIFFKVKD